MRLGDGAESASGRGVEGSCSEDPSVGQSGGAIEVAAGSFQCVWFFSLGSAHQQPVMDWFRKQSTEDAGCLLAGSVAELPQLTAAPKLTPAERRWRKKQAAMQQDAGGDAEAAASPVAGGRQRPEAAGRDRGGGRQQAGSPVVKGRIPGRPAGNSAVQTKR